MDPLLELVDLIFASLEEARRRNKIGVRSFKKIRQIRRIKSRIKGQGTKVKHARKVRQAIRQGTGRGSSYNRQRLSAR